MTESNVTIERRMLIVLTPDGTVRIPLAGGRLCRACKSTDATVFFNEERVAMVACHRCQTVVPQ